MHMCLTIVNNNSNQTFSSQTSLGPNHCQDVRYFIYTGKKYTEPYKCSLEILFFGHKDNDQYTSQILGYYDV
jgi:hypothetical protein